MHGGRLMLGRISVLVGCIAILTSVVAGPAFAQCYKGGANPSGTKCIFCGCGQGSSGCQTVYDAGGNTCVLSGGPCSAPTLRPCAGVSCEPGSGSPICDDRSGVPCPMETYSVVVAPQDPRTGKLAA